MLEECAWMLRDGLSPGETPATCAIGYRHESIKDKQVRIYGMFYKQSLL